MPKYVVLQGELRESETFVFGHDEHLRALLMNHFSKTMTPFQSKHCLGLGGHPVIVLNYLASMNYRIVSQSSPGERSDRVIWTLTKE